jgi:hypothetical protein
VHLYEPVEAKCEKELALRQRGQCFEQRSWLDRRRAQQVVDFTAHIFDGSTVAQMRTNELMHARRHGIKPKLRSDLRSYPGIKELVVFPESDDSGGPERGQAYVRSRSAQSCARNHQTRRDQARQEGRPMRRNSLRGLQAKPLAVCPLEGYELRKVPSADRERPKFPQHCHPQNVH